MKLNRKKEFGTISPPWQPEDCDRAAHYEQDGKLFDAHDRQIVPGVAAVHTAPEPIIAQDDEPAPAAEARQDQPAPEPETPINTAEELLAQADGMHWSALKRQAQEIFGNAIIFKRGGGKQGIIDSIKNAMTAQEQGVEVAPERPVSSGLTWGAMTGAAEDDDEEPEDMDADDEDAEEFEPDPPPPLPKGLPKSDVDLSAWGRGQRDYLFGEVQRTIRAQYNRQVLDRKDAVEFLIDERLIPAHEARRDV